MAHDTNVRLTRPGIAGLVGGIALAALLLGGAVGCESTDALCDEACRAWDNCTPDPRPVPACNVTGWPYQACFDACKRDDNWSSGYVDCITRSNMCCDMEGCD